MPPPFLPYPPTRGASGTGGGTGNGSSTSTNSGSTTATTVLDKPGNDVGSSLAAIPSTPLSSDVDKALPRGPDNHPSWGDDQSSRTSRLSSQPSEDEMAMVSECLTLFQRAREKRRPIVGQWNKNVQVMSNRTWLAGRASWLPRPEVPEIYPILASLVGWMTDQRPTAEVSPTSQPHSPYHDFYSTIAWDLQTTMQAALKAQTFEFQSSLAMWDSMLTGTGILKTNWDARLVGGLGDATITRTDPWTFYPDPFATSLDDSTYFIEARTMSAQEMDRRWPGSINHIRPGTIHEVDKQPDLTNTSNGEPMANIGAMHGSSRSSYGRPGQSRARVVEEQGVTVLECWLRDHEYITLPNTDVESVKERWRVVVVAGNRVLMNEYADDIWGHGQHPYDTFTPHPNGHFWGYSMVEWLVPSQIAINSLLARIMQHIDITADPIFMESQRSGIRRSQIMNKPGQRVTTNDPNGSDWLKPPEISPLAFQLIEWFVNEMERTSGLTAIARGMMAGGRPAQGVVDQLQEASFVRVRMAVRGFEWAFKRAAEKMASLIVENYTEARTVQITGPQAQKSSLALRSYHFYSPTPNGRLPMRFNLDIEAGSSLATSRSARIAEADALFAMGAIDELAVLEAHRYPNHVAIADRVQKAKAAAMMEAPGARQRTGRSS